MSEQIIEGEVIEASWSMDQPEFAPLVPYQRTHRMLDACPLPSIERKTLTWNEIHGIVIFRGFYAFTITINGVGYDILVTRKTSSNHLITVCYTDGPERDVNRAYAYAQCTPSAYESEFWMAVGIAAAQLGG